MKFCPKCGFNLDALGDEVRKEMNFCPECKFPVKKTEPSLPSENERDESFYIRLLEEKKYIEAIREHRLATGLGLKEAKEYIERLAEKNHLSVQNTMTDSKKRFWLFLIVSCFLGLMIASAGMAAFPELGFITKPFFGGDLLLESQTFYSNGENVFIQVFFYSFVMYSLILLILLYLRYFIKKKLKEHQSVV